MAKRIQSKVFTLTQECKPDYFPKLSSNYDVTDTVQFAQGVMSLLAKDGKAPTRWAVIKHNQDVRQLDNDTIEPKQDHYHFYMEWDKRQDLSHIAKVIGVKSQYFEKLKSGRYAKENALAYLIHAKQPEKHLYRPTNVYCNDSTVTREEGDKEHYSNGWYIKYYDDHASTWHSYRRKRNNQKLDESLDDVLYSVAHGEITRQQVRLTDKYYDLYYRHKKQFEDAFNALGERKADISLKHLRRGDFKLKTYFITGPAGAGKTYFSNEVVKGVLKARPNWSLFDGASTNPFDGYAGEEIVRLDDLRGNSMQASDWLKLMDPYNSTSLSARYHNARPAQRVLIITSTQDPITFFTFAKNSGGTDEALDQFIRRIQSTVTVIKYEDFTKYMNTLNALQGNYDRNGTPKQLGSFDKMFGNRIDEDHYVHSGNSLVPTPQTVQGYAPTLQSSEAQKYIKQLAKKPGPKVMVSKRVKTAESFPVAVKTGKSDSVVMKTINYTYQKSGVASLDDAVKALVKQILHDNPEPKKKDK